MVSYPKQDTIAGLVVFLVALPLCLGIAVACGVPPVSGIIAGIVGGVVVPMISRSPLSVSGPAAGLTAVVLVEVERLGGIEPFLAAVVLAGILQAGLGLARVGHFSTIVPSAVIQGMLAAIGLTIVFKQLPVAVGVKGGFAEISQDLHMGAALIGVGSLGLLYLWKLTPLAKIKVIPPALVVVLAASIAATLLEGEYELASHHYVDVPLGGIQGLMGAVPRPDLSAIARYEVWIAAMTIAVVASLESLLSIQAVDRLDPLRRRTPTDRELVAQGIGGAVSGLLGGLPITSVIVRSGANVEAGGRERLSAVVHGVLLLAAVVFAGPLLNRIPLACLAAVLIQVGLNLCKPNTFRQQFALGWSQMAPFLITIGAVLALDLLKGVIIGIVVGAAFVLLQNASGTLLRTVDDDGTIRIRFKRDGTFLVKPALLAMIDGEAEGSRIVVEATGEYIDHDVKEALASFLADAESRGFVARVEGVDLAGIEVGGGH